MQRLTIGREEYRDKVLACWLGKNIGGTLGAPLEGRREVNDLTFYDPVPKKAAPNDDLDLQLVWLKLLEDRGTEPSLPDLAEYWSRYAASYPWNEYGFFMRNYSRGLRPPVAGCFENYFVDEMGSPIRSEIWACLHPGDPQTAAALAWNDSALDHAGGEGTCGEMFWAAVESAAFVESDPITLIRLGLNMIPLSSHVGRSIREAVWCRENGLDWAAARERIAGRFGHLQPCNAIPNHGFTIIGWLYGRNFGDRLCKAVNCGYDTDCTGATLGSLLGILGGTAGIPDRWRKPVGEAIVVHPFTRNFTPPATVQELAERTVALAEKIAAVSEERAFGDETVKPDDLLTRLHRNDMAVAALRQDNHMGVELCNGRTVEFHYGGEPVLRPGIGRDVRVTVGGEAVDGCDMRAPDGWTVERLGGGSFRLFSAGSVADHNHVTVSIPAVGSVDFVVLGPGEAKGFPAGDNVEKCPLCQARVEACICTPEAKQALAAIERARGGIVYIRDWHVVGPFSSRKSTVSLGLKTPVDGLATLAKGRIDVGRAIVAPGRRLAWKAVKADRSGLVDLAKTVGQAEQVAAYGYARLTWKRDETVTLGLASDDGIRVWVNGHVVHTNEVGRPCGLVSDLVKVNLRCGANHILVKIDNYVGEWGFRVGVVKI